MNCDRIEKTIILKATRERVWQAVGDTARFGVWFGAEFDGRFAPGQWLSGRIVPTQVDPEIAALQEPARGMPFKILIEAVEPMERLAFRWHPFAIDPNVDYSSEPMTLVTFELAGIDGGIVLTISEIGFDRLPEARRAQARQANDGGWEHQTRLIEKYLAITDQA